MHELAPVFMPVFVIEPATQSLHDAVVDIVENLPAAHAVHMVAPATAPVSVIAPAWHRVQKGLPPCD